MKVATAYWPSHERHMVCRQLREWQMDFPISEQAKLTIVLLDVNLYFYTAAFYYQKRAMVNKMPGRQTEQKVSKPPGNRVSVKVRYSYSFIDLTLLDHINFANESIISSVTKQ